MKHLLILLFAFFLMSNTACEAQIANKKETKVLVYGNCGMCKKTIEKAANMSSIVQANWNKDTKMLSVSFDSSKTNIDEILKKVAAAGYDSDKFKAPTAAYNDLPGCCQYDRPASK